MMENLKPFAFTGLIWLVVSEGIYWVIQSNFNEDSRGFVWVGVIWALSLLNLFSLVKLIYAVFLIQSGKKRREFKIQALCWGIFKLVCLGLFIIILLQGQKIPLYGLLLGLGTLVVVPLVGGFIWSQRVHQNA